MIELTRGEALEILKSISAIEGYLISVEDSSKVLGTTHWAVDLLTEKIKENK